MRLLYATFILLINSCIFAQSAPITIDGLFNDWTSDLSTYTDPVAGVSGIDLIEMQVTNDQEYLYIKLIIDTEINLTTGLIPQNLMLFIDTDNNQTTGYPIQIGYGSELGVRFKDRFAYYNVDPDSEVSFSDIGLIPAPTVTSNIFEIAISRDAIPDGINPLFPSSTIRILFKDLSSDDCMPDVNDVFFYTFDETPVTPIELTELNKQSPELIRILAYNTLYNGLSDSDRIPYFENVLKALQPDIIGFSECGDTYLSDVKDLLDNWLPLGNSQGWYVNRDTTNDLITASKWEIIQVWQSLYRQFPVLIDLPEGYHTDLLFTNAHLRCCGANTERQDQVDEYVAFMLDAIAPGGAVNLPENTPFVYAGDLNLVGYAQQLNTLITGDIQNTATYGVGGYYDWDETEVSDPVSRQTDKRMAVTWKDDSSSFPDGRLDYMLYSNAVMSLNKSYVLQTETMPTSRLDNYNLLELATSHASDHFPIVADFLPNVSTEFVKESALLKAVYPNPTTDFIFIEFHKNKKKTIYIYDTKGVLVLKQSSKRALTKINLKDLNKGIYILSVNYDNHIFKIKLIKK
jgi:endonuclease/exonuclease/phosphatase family metal-dependent hydrolase